MVPYDARSGEFRVHYAGFFDPGFGWGAGKASGSKAVLEVRSYGVAFTSSTGRSLDGSAMRRSLWVPQRNCMVPKECDRILGQGVALAKHFKKWPHLERVLNHDQELIGWWQGDTCGTI